MAGTDADGNGSMPEPLLIEQLVFDEVIHSDKGTVTLLQTIPYCLRVIIRNSFLKEMNLK